MTTKNILQRLSDVMAQVEYIKKEKSVSTGGDGSYKAVTHDQVAGMVRGEFVKHGIVIVPSLVSHTLAETGQVSKSGVNAVRVEAVYRVDFVNVDDRNDLVSVSVLSHGIDSGDKAPGKVLSYAVKYAILKVLLIETGENDESRYGADDGLDVDEIVAIEGRMRACTTKPALREALEEAHAAAREANDPGASKRFTNTAKALAEKLPDVKMPEAKQPEAQQPAAPEAPVSDAERAQEPVASKGLVASIRNMAKAKGIDVSVYEPIERLSKSAAARLLSKLSEAQP